MRGLPGWGALAALVGGLLVGLLRANGELELPRDVPEVVGVELPVEVRDAEASLLSRGEASAFEGVPLGSIPALAVAWRESVDGARLSPRGASWLAGAGQSPLLLRALEERTGLSRERAGLVLAPTLAEVAEPPPSPDERQRVLDALHEMLATEVGFAAEVRLGDSDLALEASNALCRAAGGNDEAFQRLRAVVANDGAAERERAIALMTLSCGWSQRAHEPLREALSGGGNLSLVAALELARRGDRPSLNRLHELSLGGEGLDAAVHTLAGEIIEAAR